MPYPIKIPPNGIHCKSKEVKQSRVQPNGNIQYQCKKCKKYFTIEQEKKVEKKEEKLRNGVGTWYKCSFNVLSRYGDAETAVKISNSVPEGIMYTSLCLKGQDGDNRHEVLTISEFDTLTLDHFKETRELKEEIEDLESRLKHAEESFRIRDEMFDDLYKEATIKLGIKQEKITYRNVAICLLVAGLAIVSGFLFFHS